MSWLLRRSPHQGFAGRNVCAAEGNRLSGAEPFHACHWRSYDPETSTYIVHRLCRLLVWFFLNVTVTLICLIPHRYYHATAHLAHAIVWHAVYMR